MKSVRSAAMLAAPFLLVASWTGVDVSASDAQLDVMRRALDAQLQMAEDRPYDATVYNDLGNLYSLSGDDGEAESAYRRAIEIDPAHASAHFNLALLQRSAGDDDAAANSLRAVIELEPRHAWALYQLGTDAVDRGDRDGAIELYARSFAADPRLSFARENPHIIDNELTTQALLLADRYREVPVREVPRQYSDADRIAQLILEVAEARDAEPKEALPEGYERDELDELEGLSRSGASGTKGVDPEDDEGETASRVLSTDDLDTSSRLGQARRGSSSNSRSLRDKARSRRDAGSVLDRYRRSSTPQPTRAEEEKAKAARGEGGGATRTRTPVAGVVRGTTIAGRGAAPGAAGADVRGGATTGLPSSRTAPAPGTTSRSDRFVPSGRSTGSLELELLAPGTPVERLAYDAPVAPVAPRG